VADFAYLPFPFKKPSFHSMASTPSTDPKLSGNDPGAAVPAPGLDEQFHGFWQSNRRSIYLGVLLVIGVVLAKEGIQYFAEQHEQGIQAAYATATTPEKLRAFIADHPGHALAGVAHLTLADAAYAAGKFADAQLDYNKAATLIAQPLLVSRAKLGLAISMVQNGQNDSGRDMLKQLADDSRASKVIRCEATYDLASLAFDAGKYDEVLKFTDQITPLDESGMWSQRALGLRVNIPVAAATPAAPKPDSGLSIKLPGQ
jgi:predicted negative regulator of RcsB-dependent stress response